MFVQLFPKDDDESVDSLEYRSTENEEREEPFTEEEIAAAMEELTTEELNSIEFKKSQIVLPREC